MSRIYFHTRERTAEVRGWERANMGHLTRQLGYDTLISALGGNLRDYIITDHELKTSTEVLGSYGVNSWSYRLKMAMTSTFSSDQPILELDGQRLSSWELLLNTALVAGGDTIKLMARIDAQCEIHARVETEDREWFAVLIENGRADGLLREGSGWEDVVALARGPFSGPIIMSYSVTGSFPSASASTWEPSGDENGELDYDEFYDLPEDEKWSRGLEWLAEHGPRLQPSDWRDYRFTHRVSAFDLAGDSWRKRIKEDANGRM